MAKQNDLTPKMRKFAEEFVKCGVETQAYKAAGYSTRGKCWQTNANDLPKNPHIQAYIRQLQEEIRPHKKQIMDAAEMQDILTNVARRLETDDFINPDGSIAERRAAIKEALKAIELLGRMQGAFLDRQQVELSGSIPVVIKDDL